MRFKDLELEGRPDDSVLTPEELTTIQSEVAMLPRIVAVINEMGAMMGAARTVGDIRKTDSRFDELDAAFEGM